MIEVNLTNRYEHFMARHPTVEAYFQGLWLALTNQPFYFVTNRFFFTPEQAKEVEAQLKAPASEPVKTKRQRKAKVG